MQVIPIESRELTQLANQIRKGVIKAYRILEGDPGPRNFSLKLVNIEGEFFSPRHRHNFDQVRFQLEGKFDYAADGALIPGTMGYFPEGTRYGPQTSDGSTWNLLLQFGGASGSGYTPEQDEDRAAGELKARGKFENGVYTTYRPDGTKVNQDAYEAIWEHIHGRPLVYPRSRYERPIFMKLDHFDWVADAVQPGVATKLLGVFSERGTRLAAHRVDAGASLALEADTIYFAIAGRGEAGGRPVGPRTTIRVLPGEKGSLVAREPMETLQISFPQF